MELTAEALATLANAREGFVHRAERLRTQEEASALRAWAASVNTQLDELAYALGDGPAVNPEAVTTWEQLNGPAAAEVADDLHEDANAGDVQRRLARRLVNSLSEDLD